MILHHCIIRMHNNIKEVCREAKSKSKWWTDQPLVATLEVLETRMAKLRQQNREHLSELHHNPKEFLLWDLKQFKLQTKIDLANYQTAVHLQKPLRSSSSRNRSKPWITLVSEAVKSLRLRQLNQWANSWSTDRKLETKIYPLNRTSNNLGKKQTTEKCSQRCVLISRENQVVLEVAKWWLKIALNCLSLKLLQPSILLWAVLTSLKTTSTCPSVKESLETYLLKSSTKIQSKARDFASRSSRFSQTCLIIDKPLWKVSWPKSWTRHREHSPVPDL